MNSSLCSGTDTRKADQPTHFQCRWMVLDPLIPNFARPCYASILCTDLPKHLSWHLHQPECRQLGGFQDPLRLDRIQCLWQDGKTGERCGTLHRHERKNGKTQLLSHMRTTHLRLYEVECTTCGRLISRQTTRHRMPSPDVADFDASFFSVSETPDPSQQLEKDGSTQH
jgi:hypothetical protein